MIATALWCALALSAPQQEPARVTATVVPQRVAVGTAATLRITVETRGQAPDDIRMPPLPAQLQTLGTSESSQMQISVPGGRSRVTRRELVLMPLEAGTYTIGSVAVLIGGSTYRTAPLELTVSAAPGGRAGAAGTGVSSLEVLLRPDTAYVGQQVLLMALATLAEDLRMRQSRPPTFDPPAPSGFWIQDVPDPITVSLRVSEGRTVETQTFRRAYFPLAAGEFRFPPARLHYEVRRGFLYAPESRELVSDSARLIVLPLPRDGQPATFNGAVGRLAMRTTLAPQRLRVGEPGVLTVELEGTGNVKALPVPLLPEFDGVEVFAPTQDSRVQVSDYTVGGSKRFRWIIVPQRPGSLVVPPLEYGVFDPELRSYVVLRSDSLRIDVAAVADDAQGEVRLRGLRRVPAPRTLRWAETPTFAALQVLPLLLLAGALGVQRRRARPPSPRQQAAAARARLAALSNASVEPDLGAAERVLCDAVSDITGLTGADPVRALRQAGRAGDAERLDRLLRDMRSARYAPHHDSDAADLINRADRLIRELTPRRSWRARAGLGLVAAAALASAGAGGAQDTDFATGVEHFEQQEFAASAARFEAYARAHRGDVNGWYNAGLAAYQSGDPGRAGWAWLRAARLAPRDADVRHNLNVLRGAEAARRIMAPDRLVRAERSLAAAAAWWLLIIAVGAALLLRRPRLAWAAAPAGAVLVAAVAVTVHLAVRPILITPLGHGATLHASPSLREEQVGRLEPASVAEVRERRGNWLRVRLPGEREAWIERAAVAAP
jgi:hypothetical protein